MYKLIVSIVPNNSGSLISSAANGAGASGGTIIPGRGTASNDILSILGLGDSSKEIVYIVVEDKIENDVRAAIEDACSKKRHFGVMFTVDVNSFIKSGTKSNLTLGEKSMDSIENNSFQMINIIVNKGYAEDAMAAARKAGAGGGTVVLGRGTAKEGDEKFFGVEIVPEKEMLVILVEQSKAEAVVEAIQNLECFSKGGSGVVFCADAKRFTLLGKR
ncbi:MAG: transcriptional regulator [Treponema sp.]|nr:transcriptional regulator [Treponema sp.]